MPVIIRATPIPILPRQALRRWFAVQLRRSDEVVTVGDIAHHHGRSDATRIGDPLVRPSLDTGRGRGTDFPVRGEKIPCSAPNRESSATP
jgi:hypothetical protein